MRSRGSGRSSASCSAIGTDRSAGGCGEGLELSLSSCTVVQLVVVARFDVDGVHAIRMPAARSKPSEDILGIPLRNSFVHSNTHDKTSKWELGHIATRMT